MGAWVASQTGGTPVPKDGNIEKTLAEVG
jgi:hypothetical protein